MHKIVKHGEFVAEPIGYDLHMTIKQWVRACVALLLFATCVVVMQPRVTIAWTPTSPQVLVSVFRGTSSDFGWSVALDSAGNIYTTGYFAGTADFDPGAGTANLTSVGENDVYVSKLDASGNYVWAKQFGGTSSDEGFEVALDSAGNIYTTGYFAGTADFDPGAGTANLISDGGTDVFVSKLDASGNYVWAKRFGGTISDNSYSVAVDSSGNVYTTGYFAGTADFDPGAGTAILTSAGSGDVFVSKLDASGNYVWAKQFGGSSASYGWSTVVDSSDNIYTTGMFYGTADFDPGAGTAILTSAGNGDVFVSKLDASGNYVWAKQFGGTNNDRGFDITVDSSGNVFTTGEFIGTADFDPSTSIAEMTSAGSEDVFVSKLDASGNYVWAKQFGGIGRDVGNSVAVDSSGNVFTTGEFIGTADFDPSTSIAEVTSAGLDVFVSKLDASGNYVWAKQFGGTSAAYGTSVAVDSAGNIYTTGYFAGRADFDPTASGSVSLTSAGSTDVFVLKLDVSDASSSVTPGTTPGAPTSVSATSSADTQSVVSWTAPAATGGATITGYTVTSSPGGRTCTWTTGALSCVVTGLTNGTRYTFSVTATNANGTGSASGASSSVTPSTTPGAPTSVSATSSADTQSVVSWTAPAATGGATITGYTVTSSPGGRTCTWTTGALSCVVTGLTRGTPHTFSVTATNANGTGSASGASSSVTPIASQSITFATVGTQLLGGKTVTLSATASSSQEVDFTSDTPIVCSVSGSTATMLTTGDCTINANQFGGSGWDAAPQVSRTFTILPSPPTGEPGVSIKNGDPYTNTKRVVLNLVWPEFATSVRISNDGGFSAVKTLIKDLAPSIDWELDDSVKGINTKVVYVRFNGVTDITKTYIDDIILDTTAPNIEISTAVVASSSIVLSLKATDDITGLDKIEIRNNNRKVTKDYATKVSVPLVDLSLSVSSSGVQKSASGVVEIRVSDNAGNWTGWETVTVESLTKTLTVSTPTVTLKKSATAKTIAIYAKIKFKTGSVLSLKVAGRSSKFCKVHKSTLKAIKVGSCIVTVTVKPKTGRSTSKTVTLKVTR